METRSSTELCFPQLLNNSCKKPERLWSEAVILDMVLLVSLLTVTLNLLIIISISHFRQLHTPTNILLLSLAVSDFLVGLLLMPLEVLRNKACWFLGDALCVLYSYLVAHVVSASIGNIILISVDRYVAICDPMHYPTRMSAARVKCCVCGCWFWYALYSVLYLKDELRRPGSSNSCSGECMVFINYAVATVDLVLNFIIPVTIIVVLYTRVFAVAVSQARAMRSHVAAARLQLRGERKERRAKASELKAARTLGILVFVYLMCYCPFYCYTLVEVSLTTTSPTPYLFFLFYFNSCLNPVIYSLFYPWFRKAVKVIVTLQILQPGSCEASML
ncbi:trace amine-associated receptor 13c-like [Poecilia latipinna]|uniref:trace amine-associated receptor 13c-like n=1 Tax=Poecilia formosa TaxID=48698 RepID=UPI000443BABD|nr:PREDICTED: trace amine-associated receptor 13c-like [Poecilia formosa]XP_014879328.1 PREDICTED: trace amine-associated receptor 13c-like [Poecilia latipinna]